MAYVSFDSDVPLEHTDFIDDDQPLVCWMFDLDALEASTDGCYDTPVLKALLRGLRTLGESRNARMRDRSFTIFMGDFFGSFGDYFCVGVPHRMASPVLDLLSGLLSSVAGYRGLEYTSTDAPLLPAYRYEHGRVVQYSDDDLAGTERDDNDDWCGSGLRILRRTWRPAWRLGRELYCSDAKGPAEQETH